MVILHAVRPPPFRAGRLHLTLINVLTVLYIGDMGAVKMSSTHLVIFKPMATNDISRWMEKNSLFIVVTQTSKEIYVASIHHDKSTYNAEIKDGHLLKSTMVRSVNCPVAIKSMVEHIEGKILVFNATSEENRIEIQAPVEFEGVDKLYASVYVDTLAL